MFSTCEELFADENGLDPGELPGLVKPPAVVVQQVTQAYGALTIEIEVVFNPRRAQQRYR